MNNRIKLANTQFFVYDVKIVNSGSHMTRSCIITKKRAMSGNNVSHANNKTLRRFKVNLHKKKIWVPELNKTVSIRLSAKALRMIDKLGPYEVLKRAELLSSKDLQRVSDQK